jgi:hypothetical protein
MPLVLNRGRSGDFRREQVHGRRTHETHCSPMFTVVCAFMLGQMLGHSAVYKKLAMYFMGLHCRLAEGVGFEPTRER